MERVYADRQDSAVSRQNRGAAAAVKESASGKVPITSVAQFNSVGPKPLSVLKAEMAAKKQAEAGRGAEGVKGNEGDPPIPMLGQRFFNHPSAEIEEIKKLPLNPTNGQVVTFGYVNEDGATVLATYTYMDVTHTYNTPNETGRWEKGVTNSMHGSGYKEGEYVTLAEVQEIQGVNRDVAQIDEPDKGVEPETGEIKAGENLEKDNTSSTDEEKVVIEEKSKPKSEEKKPKTKDSKNNKDPKKDPEKEMEKEKEEEPPSITSKAEFKLRDDWFEKGPDRDQAYSSLREISNFLKKKPKQTFVVHIYIKASGAKASDSVGGGFMQSGPETPYSGRALSDLAYGRYLTVKNIILDQSGLSNVNLIYIPHFNSSVHMFKVVPQK